MALARSSTTLLITALIVLVTAVPARGEQAVALLPSNTIATFDVASPSVLSNVRPVTGLGLTETLRGLDVRVPGGELLGSTVTTGSANNSVVKTYAIDRATGVATFVGESAAALAGAGDVPAGYDINPRFGLPPVDRIRYMNTNDENGRFNPFNGTLSGNDTDLTPAATTALIAAAYDRNTDGATATLYAVDRDGSALARVGGVAGTTSANAGVVTDLVPLGFALAPAADGALDISPSGVMYAALTSNADNVTRLYRFTPAGDAVALDAVGGGTQEVRSLTVIPDPPASPAAPAPPAPPPAVDSTRPALLLALGRSSAKLGSLRKGLVYEFSCNEACSFSATLAIAGGARSAATVARGSSRLAAAGKGRVRVKATSSGRRTIARLRRARRRRAIRATLTTRATDQSGNASVVRKRIALKR